MFIQPHERGPVGWMRFKRLTLVDDDGDDVGFAPRESCESSRGACHNRLDRGAVLGRSIRQARQNLHHLAVADRYMQTDEVRMDLLAVAISMTQSE